MTIYRTPIPDRKIFIEVLLANPEDVAKSAVYRALVDTGSQETLISQRIIDRLQLVPAMDRDSVTTVDVNGHEVISFRHRCFLQIQSNGRTFDIYPGLLTRRNLDTILGMDILETGEVRIQNNIFTFNIE